MAKKTYSKSSKTETPKGIPALQFLETPGQYIAPDKSIPLIVLFGDEPYLQQKSIQAIEAAFSVPGEEEIELKRFNPQETRWSDINEELSFVSMFGPQRRLVLMEQADKFITPPSESGKTPSDSGSNSESNQDTNLESNQDTSSRKKKKAIPKTNRELLEDNFESGNPMGTLILTVQSFPSNTRLFKITEQNGLIVNCSAVEVATLDSWLYKLATGEYKANIDRNAVSMLIDRVGNSMGLLEQEIVKLVSYANGKKIDRSMVEQLGGTWAMQTAWGMLDCALAGNLDQALRNLDSLMSAGDHPVMITAQLAVSLRKMAMAQRMVRDAQLARTPLSFTVALKQLGQRFYLEKSEQQYRRLGEGRVAELLRWLEELDFAIKGDSQLNLKLLMERFLIRLAAR